MAFTYREAVALDLQEGDASINDLTVRTVIDAVSLIYINLVVENITVITEIGGVTLQMLGGGDAGNFFLVM